MAHGHQHGAQQQGPFPLPGVNNIIAVGSGKGGVGKTTVAVNLAVALAKMGYKTGLLDADVYGPNVPMMMAINQQPRVLNENLGFLNPGDKPIVWRGPMLHQIIRQFLQQVVWGELDYLVVDLPPGTGDVVISLFQTVPLTGAVVVSTPSDVSLQDGRKAIEMFRTARVDVLGLVENMSNFLCPHCHQEIDIFSKGGVERTAKEFGVPFLGTIELDPEIRKGGDSGKPPALAGENDPHSKGLYEFAKKVLMRLAEVKSTSAPGDVIQVQ
jgi:ATP-binding protein involved in chromosome partitioning